MSESSYIFTFAVEIGYGVGKEWWGVVGAGRRRTRLWYWFIIATRTLSRNALCKALDLTQNTLILYYTVLSPQLSWQFYYWLMPCTLVWALRMCTEADIPTDFWLSSPSRCEWASCKRFENDSWCNFLVVIFHFFRRPFSGETLFKTLWLSIRHKASTNMSEIGAVERGFL